MEEKNIESCFDVTIGSFDGTEICELVGIHVLSLISSKLDKQSTGLYRDEDSYFEEIHLNRKQTEYEKT